MTFRKALHNLNGSGESGFAFVNYKNEHVFGVDMNRREFLECAAVLVGGLSLSQVSFSLNDEQMAYLATAPDYTSRQAKLFSEQQRRLIAAMAEVIIPRTDTPGASDAGVPHFIELMVEDWFNDQERATFLEGMREMETQIPLKYGKHFAELSNEQQLSVMVAMEEAASDSVWYQQGNTRRPFISDAPFICQVKELTSWGFFTSEVGATQVLRSNMMPMRFDGDIPLSPNESSWAPFRF